MPAPLRKQLLLPIAALFLLTTAFVLAEDWVTYSGADATVMFPVKPDVDSQTVTTAIGPLTMYTCMLEIKDTTKDDNVLYGYIVTAYPADKVNSDNKDMLERYFDGAVSGAASNIQGKLISQNNIELGGYPGRSARISIMNGQYTVTMNTYLVHNKGLIMQVISPSAKEGNPSSKKFLGSIKLKG